MNNINPRIGAKVCCNFSDPETGERMAWCGLVFGVNPKEQVCHVRWLGPCGVLDERQAIPFSKFHEAVYDDSPEWTFTNPEANQ